jgi:2-succinyl-5-enolpyruvyl-6-hydroxy-3-cyclohexene-1-carboxylate synthase
MSQIGLARNVLLGLAQIGVNEVVVCAGARNAPLVSLLSAAKGVAVFSFFEERSAAFFALGRSLATSRPVAVITTSGTAAAELLPATIEADYQGVPLVLVTADRPKAYRGQGAPQAIVQPGLYSHYIERDWDIEDDWQGEFSWSGRRPVHINVCFDEPLLDESVSEWFWPTAPVVNGDMSLAILDNQAINKPVILVGSLNRQRAAEVQVELLKWRRPVYLEATSQLRGSPALAALSVTESALKALLSDCDAVIRIGGVPTTRIWRDLEKSSLPVLHFSYLNFSGLGRGGKVSPLQQMKDLETATFAPYEKSAAAIETEQHLQRLLDQHPRSEPGWLRWLSQQIAPLDAKIFLGNSLPIREWDLAAIATCRAEVIANRGVNGIDGLISTFLGQAVEQRSNWCIVGDLSALYDLTGPWALTGRRLQDVNIVVINNGGGKIFERMFKNSLFENPHNLNFEHWAKMWKLDYLRLTEQTIKLEPAMRPRVIEILPDAAQTAAFWSAWEDRA